MNRIILIELGDLSPRIHMKPLDKPQDGFHNIYGSLKFKDDKFMGLAYKYSNGEKLYYYNNDEYGILFCDEEMDERICYRLVDLDPEGKGYTRCLNRNLN